MDTSSHILIGFGLAALAQADPIVSSSTALTQAVIIGSVVGSNAPDFDIFYKLKGNSSYYKNHRSHSHSLPILPLWALLIFAFIAPFFQNISYTHLFLWIFIAVIIHVVTDLFNVHGTQILLPINRDWISLDTLPLLDPFIVLLHLTGFYCLLFFQPGTVFTYIYAVMIVYVLTRFLYQIWIKNQLKTHFVRAVTIKLIPKASFLKWDVLIETSDDFLFGSYYINSLYIEHTISKQIAFPEVIKNCPSHQTVSDFLDSTSYAYPFVEKRKNGYWLFWKDLRFRSNKLFSFLSIVYLSPDGSQIYSTYSGWIYSLKQLRRIIKRLKTDGHLEKEEI